MLLGLADEFDLVLRGRPAAGWPEIYRSLSRYLQGIFPDELLAALDELMAGGLYEEVATNVALELKMFDAILHLPPVNFQVEEPMQVTINLFAQIIDAKHTYTAGHSRRVADYAMRLAGCLGFREEEIRRLEIAGLLHDFGKIAVPRAILDKPGRLDARELQVVHRHPARTIDLLTSVSSLKDIAHDAGLHHERYDGRGYPFGLRNGEIPPGARIIAVANAFDAMTSLRPYQATRTPEEALAVLIQGGGSQFDPEVVEAAPCLLT
ncbi:MAG: HD-GYP domain-containing protein [Moorella sp. (in: Bacteria)]|nr:HD-GYP domain-containing protein [Moorella sp. (in: firmicutes)]